MSLLKPTFAVAALCAVTSFVAVSMLPPAKKNQSSKELMADTVTYGAVVISLGVAFKYIYDIL